MADKYPKLCGGLLFELLLQALRQKNNARQHYKGERDGLSNPEVLVGLIRVMYPDYQEPPQGSFKQDTSDYRKFRKSKGEYLPFDSVPIINAFCDEIKEDYQLALVRMTEFTERFLEVGTSGKKDVWLVKALIEIIANDCGDGGIDDAQPFYCLENGRNITKSEIVKLTAVCLPSFLLGIWHFIIDKRRDNNPDDGKLDVNTIGNRITQTISVSMPKTTVTDKSAVCADEQDSETTESPADIRNEWQPAETPCDIADPKRITVNNYGTVQNQKFVSIETMNGDIHL